MFLTLGEAAKQVGKNKTTIQRAIKSGRLSANKQDDGSYKIDPAELFRVYGTQQRDSRTQPREKQEISLENDNNPENSVHYWRGLHVASERERQHLEATVADLRTRLDAAEEERRATQARLEDLRKRPRWRFW